MQNNNVMVYAYTKYNLGDDLLIKILCDRYRDKSFSIYTYPEYKTVLSECDNLKVISNSRLFAKLTNKLGAAFHRVNAYERSVAKKCDLCVCITGSLFIQGSSNWKSYLEYMKSKWIDGRPYFQIGSNFGPYTDPLFLDGFTDLFRSYTDICFRESYSRALFPTLTNVRVAPDVVLSGNYEKYMSLPQEKRVAVSVINLSDRTDLSQYQEKYIRVLENICNYYLQEGYIVDLLSFCKLEGDENTISELEQRISNERLVHHCYVTDTDLQGMLSCIGKAEIVVASRFHAMILGWAMGKKTLPMIYSSKMKNVIDDLGYTGQYYDIKSGRDFDVNQIELQLFDVSSICDEANKQFEKLDLYL